MIYLDPDNKMIDEENNVTTAEGAPCTLRVDLA